MKSFTSALLRLSRMITFATVLSASLAAARAQTFQVLHEWGGPNEGTESSSLIVGTDGRLYGTTYDGGIHGLGTLFAINVDGTGFTILRHFDGADGRSPYAGLIEGTDGRLYGATAGTLFSLNTLGSGFIVLREIGSPYAGLIEGTDGRLYGMTLDSVFALNTDGSGFVVLHQFSNSTDGSSPVARLMEGADGRMYGSTVGGGTYNFGTLFAINPDGSGFTVLRHLNGSTDGSDPVGGLTEGSDGRLYGTNMQGGDYGEGTLFSLNPDGSDFSVLRHFRSSIDADGSRPWAGLIGGVDGRLYGATSEGGVFGHGTLFAFNPDDSVFTVLHSFYRPTDGGQPRTALAEDAVGRLYGSTSVGEFGGGTPPPARIFVLSIVPEITSALTATGDFKRPFNYTITATNDPDDFDALGLPTGLAANHDTGLISGLPREKGEFAVTIAASNAYGTGVADLSLTIAPAPPAITRQPQHATAIANKNVTFSVTAKSTTKLSYQWLRDDQPIPGATGHKLMLRKITSDDAGSYRVIVTNSVGSVQSDSAILTVLPARAPNSGVAAKAGAGARR